MRRKKWLACCVNRVRRQRGDDIYFWIGAVNASQMRLHYVARGQITGMDFLHHAVRAHVANIQIQFKVSFFEAPDQRNPRQRNSTVNLLSHAAFFSSEIRLTDGPFLRFPAFRNELPN